MDPQGQNRTTSAYMQPDAPAVAKVNQLTIRRALDLRSKHWHRPPGTEQNNTSIHAARRGQNRKRVAQKKRTSRGDEDLRTKNTHRPPGKQQNNTSIHTARSAQSRERESADDQARLGSERQAQAWTPKDRTEQHQHTCSQTRPQSRK